MCSTNLIVKPPSVLALSGERASVWPTYMFRGFVTRNKNWKSKSSGMLRSVDFMSRGEERHRVVQIGNLEMYVIEGVSGKGKRSVFIILYYIKNKQDATLAVLFISHCSVTLHVPDAICVHHQEH